MIFYFATRFNHMAALIAILLAWQPCQSFIIILTISWGIIAMTSVSIVTSYICKRG